MLRAELRTLYSDRRSSPAPEHLLGLAELSGGMWALLFFREAVSDEGGDAPGGRRINVCQHCDDVSALRINSQLAVHSGRPAAVAEIAHSTLRPVHEAVSIFVAVTSIHFAGGQEFRVGGVEQFVVRERICKSLQIFDCRVAASCRGSAIRQG